MTIERTGPLAAQKLDRINETTARVVPDERTH
jgi:hypothetical protein